MTEELAKKLESLGYVFTIDKHYLYGVILNGDISDKLSLSEYAIISHWLLENYEFFVEPLVWRVSPTGFRWRYTVSEYRHNGLFAFGLHHLDIEEASDIPDYKTITKAYEKGIKEVVDYWIPRRKNNN